MRTSFSFKDLRSRLRLGNYARQNIVPRNLPAEDTEGFAPQTLLAEQGLDYHLEKQRQRLQSWSGNLHQDMFRRLRADSRINTCGKEQVCLHNGYYPTPDAEVYAAMIMDFHPQQILEIGSGFSTIIARRTIQSQQLPCLIRVIDPQPRTDVTDVADKIIRKPVEEVQLSEIALPAGSILFIDSSHICRGRGDIPQLYCRIIPQLSPGVIVHVHDIFLPYDYPLVYLRNMYTEQYVLYALLLNGTRYEVVFSTHYMARHYPHEMQTVFGPAVGAENLYLGASFWFRTT